MKRLLYIWMLVLLCIPTIQAESVTFSTNRLYRDLHSAWTDSEESTERNKLKNDYAIQSNEHVKVQFMNPGTDKHYYYMFGVPTVSDFTIFHTYYIWISASQVNVTLLNEHVVIDNIKVTYVTSITPRDEHPSTIHHADFSTNFPEGQTSYLYTFSQSNQKINSITVNYHFNHEYGETGAAYYTCQVCGHVDATRQAACADQALHLTAVGADMTIGMQKTGNPADYLMQFSLDKQNWTTVTLTATTELVTIPAGQTCYFRHGGDTPIERMAGNQNNCWSFTMTGEGTIEAGGNVMSMLDIAAQKSTMKPYPVQHAFTGLFKGCDKLTVAPELPATTIGQFCYMYMFAGTSITEAPTLPATTIPDGAYYGMFQDCKNLTTVPALPGTSLSRVAYKYMFLGCDNLTSVEIANITHIGYDHSKPTDNPFIDWLTDTAIETNGVLIAPNEMVKNAEMRLPDNWQYKQISDFVADILQAFVGLKGALLEIAEDYLRQVNEANDYATAKAAHDLAIRELTALQKCTKYIHDNSYTDPTGAGYRLQIVTSNGRSYEFRAQDVQKVDYYRAE